MNVMIVDDEPIIRVGLRRLIDWEQHGMHLVGEASDGEEALAFLNEHPVDLLVTDIRMPRMDGLELIRQCKQAAMDVGIVVLSCLDDFSFVKEAMKLGAYDYILKPTMEPDELVSILKLISGKLEEERREKARIRELNDRLEQSRPYRLQAKILHYLEHGEPGPELGQELFKDGMKLYSLMVCTMPGQVFSVRESEHEDVLVAVRLHETQQLLLIECERSISENEWYQHSYLTAKKLLSQWNEMKDTAAERPFILMGPPMNELDELPNRIAYHREQLSNRFYMNTAGEIYMEAPVHREGSELVNAGEKRNNLLRAISGSNEEAMKLSLQEMLEAIRLAEPELPRLHAFVLETVGLAVGYARDNGYIGIHELEQQYVSIDTIMSIHSYSELSRWLTRFFSELANSRKGIRLFQDVQHPFIRKAIAFIRDNYHRNIGTADIAEYVKLSRSYLSDLYSKEVGESLTETLTRIRIEAACQLLQKTDKKIYEIAERVGFNDSKTFTKTFKRIVGCSPKEYPLSNK